MWLRSQNVNRGARLFGEAMCRRRSRAESGLSEVEFLVPLPRGLDDRLQRLETRGPPEHFLCSCVVSHKACGVSGPAVSPLDGELSSADLAHHFDDFRHRVALIVAQIERRTVVALAKIFESENVGVGQVGDVNVVADASAVRRRIVVAENADRIPLALGGEDDERDQMELFFVGLTDFGVGICAPPR